MNSTLISKNVLPVPMSLRHLLKPAAQTRYAEQQMANSELSRELDLSLVKLPIISDLATLNMVGIKLNLFKKQFDLKNKSIAQIQNERRNGHEYEK